MIQRLRSYLERPGMGPQLVKAVAGSAGLRILGMGLGFLVGVQLARGLGPAGYGVYGTAMAIIAVLMIPTELGLPQLIMREVAAAIAVDGIGATAAIVRWARKVVVFSSVAIAGIALCVLAMDFFTISHPVRMALLVGLIWIPVVAIGNIYGAALRGMRHIVSGQVSETLVRPAIIAFVLFLVALQERQELNAATAMGINVIGATVAAGLSIFLFKRAYTIVAALPVFAPAGLRFSHALPMAMTEGMRILGAQVSILVLAAMASKEQVGLYRVAYGIYVATTMPSALINVACAPTISRLFTQGRTQELARLNIWISVFLTGSATAFILLHCVAGKVAVSTLFGVQYADAAKVLLIFLLGEFAASLFGHPTVVLNMMRRQRIVMLWSAAALIVNFLSSWILVNTVGYVGAAVGSVTGLTVWRAGCAFYAKRRLGLDTSLATKMIKVSSGAMSHQRNK